MLIRTYLLFNGGRRIQKLIVARYLKDFLLISLGVGAASIGLKGFLLPNDFLDGGAMGLSLLAQIVTDVDLSLLIMLINIPFLVLGVRQVSKTFALKSSLAIVALSVVVYFIQIPPVTEDKLLISVFGGFFLGAGIGFAIRGGAVIDGTEVLAIFVSRRTSLTVGDFIAIFNVVLFSGAIFLINVETAMYSMLTYFAASKTVDFIINGIEEYIGVTIISERGEIIREIITSRLGRGVTIYKSEGGYGKTGLVVKDRKILFCVVTRLEVARLLHEIEKIDQGAFVLQHPIRDTKGGMIKKRPLH
ncbi:MAG: YitT family protein [Bacteroidetes bacterium]|nr:YitT family protein [Bacteroidota bacterium]